MGDHEQLKDHFQLRKGCNYSSAGKGRPDLEFTVCLEVARSISSHVLGVTSRDEDLPG